ncbi:recombinase family protein [Rhizobium laguerreae]|uniref:recombinase family protein n=1 Tax=Rhizobium laguerreae TaxID=1076926 RepID=UPI001C9222AF|nr:recombinase family protein [Rhizobium laguerreae]MBY3504014.1 recombinase family protein [Rhizobium laguerreae]
MSTILYARVSTTEQNLDHQLTQAQAAGFQIDEVIADHGVSGVSTTLAERPQGKRLFDKLRSGDTLVVRWIDRLGRNYQDVTDVVRQFLRGGVVIRTVINAMTFDGSTRDPMQQAVRDSLLSFLAAMAQAQAEVTREAQKAGIEAARGDGEKYRGKKPSYDRATFDLVCDHLASGAGASSIAKLAGLSRQTVLRIRTDPANAETSLRKWGL